jgi:hypothetical protein
VAPKGWRHLKQANRAAFLQVAKVLGTKTCSNEDITRAIRHMARTGAGADMRALVQARAAVPPETWQKIAEATHL